MKSIYFYALKSDLLSVLSRLEDECSVLYYEEGMLAGPSPATYRSGADLPRIGEATGDQHVACDSYLIVEENVEVNVRTKLMFNGKRRWDVDQIANPESVTLTSGGEWLDGSLISGSIATLSDSAKAQKLMKSAHRAMKKNFTRVQAYWVGPEALISFKAGKRLCAAIQSPPEYNLRETAPASNGSNEFEGSQ